MTSTTKTPDEDWYDDDEPDEGDTAPCPECGKPVDYVADRCPACGYWILEPTAVRCGPGRKSRGG